MQKKKVKLGLVNKYQNEHQEIVAALWNDVKNKDLSWLEDIDLDIHYHFDCQDMEAGFFTKGGFRNDSLMLVIKDGVLSLTSTFMPAFGFLNKEQFLTIIPVVMKKCGADNLAMTKVAHAVLLRYGWL